MSGSSTAELRNVSVEKFLSYDNSMDLIPDRTVCRVKHGLESGPPLWRPVVDGYSIPIGYGEFPHTNSHGDIPGEMT